MADSDESEQAAGCLVMVGILVVVIIWFSSCGGDSQPDPMAGAWVACQDFVRDRLKAPSTAEFPASYTNYTEKATGDYYVVEAWVDSENSFGAQIRTEFHCRVREESDRWVLTTLRFDD